MNNDYEIYRAPEVIAVRYELELQQIIGLWWKGCVVRVPLGNETKAKQPARSDSKRGSSPQTEEKA
jgi:hypothetical protein